MGASRVAPILATVLLVLPGCGGNTATSPDKTPASASAAASDSTESPSTRGLAGEAARRALSTWARPDLTYETWWADLKPLLSPQGRQDYADTDPALIPPLVIRRVRVLVEDATSAVVAIATDQGRFKVQLSRPIPTRPWLMDRIVFPGVEAPAGAEADEVVA